MGWRFRKSFRIIPGLRLNLSRSGLSASIGGAPFTVNVGPRGVMGTASIPGTGISYRQHFGSPSPRQPSGVPDSNEPGTIPLPTPNVSIPLPLPSRTSAAPIEEVRSASTELLTSASLADLKKLLQMTFQEREDISHEIEIARSQKGRTLTRYEKWDNGFLFKRIFKKAFAIRKEEAETATAKLSELEEQLKLTTVATHVEIEKEQAEPYFRMRDDFAGLCECEAMWDVKTHQATDKFHERTTANTRIGRERVKFVLGTCDLIQWEQKVPHLQNAKGGDLYLYPGFILYRAGKEAFSVIDYHDLGAKPVSLPFHEEEGVPKDSKVIGQTWAKANKDGTRDRRFANNYQIPIALYGGVTFRSGGGLWEEFQFSNPERLLRFLTSLSQFVASFGTTPPNPTAN